MGDRAHLSDPGLHHAARLRALGRLLDRRRYLADGLAILADGDDYAVTGLRRPSRWRRAAVACAETITAAELDAIIAARGWRRRG